MTDEQEGQVEQKAQMPIVVEVEDLRAIADPLQRQKRMDASLRENIAPLPERVRLMQADGFTMYAVGWSVADMLVEQVDDADGSVIAKDQPLGSFSTHAPWYLNQIDGEILKQIKANRPKIVLRSPNKPQAGNTE